MAFERIELNICPAGDMPVFHCSQFDTGRPIIIDLKNGDDAFTPSAGTTFELHCRKVDDNIVTLDTYEVDGNTLTFTSTEQLCACPGDNLCEVAIYLDELCMGTLNFMLHVEPDPLAGGLESETQIYNLTEQVEEITEQVIGDNYYDKTEVDDLLDTKADAATTYTKTETDTLLGYKANASQVYTMSQTDLLLADKADKSTTYTKTQVDTALALKADAATTYTKTEVDTALALKANASDVYTKSEVYNKTETYTQAQVDALIAGIFPTKSASGAIASFTTALAMPLVSCTTAEGATTVTRCGVNFANNNLTLGWWCDGSGNVIPNTSGARTDYIYLHDRTVYFKVFQPSYLYSCSIVELDASLNFIKRNHYASGFGNEQTVTLDSNTKAIYIQVYDEQHNMSLDIYNNAQVMLGTTSGLTTYHPYNGQTVPVAAATTLVTQSGLNNVFADSGDITVQYKDTTL